MKNLIGNVLRKVQNQNTLLTPGGNWVHYSSSNQRKRYIENNNSKRSNKVRRKLDALKENKQIIKAFR